MDRVSRAAQVAYLGVAVVAGKFQSGIMAIDDFIHPKTRYKDNPFVNQKPLITSRILFGLWGWFWKMNLWATNKADEAAKKAGEKIKKARADGKAKKESRS